VENPPPRPKGGRSKKKEDVMGCGCKERRAIGRDMVSAFRKGDYAALNQHTRQMGASLAGDLSGLRARPSTYLRPREIEPQPFHVRQP
jgi:hypothetical protein